MLCVTVAAVCTRAVRVLLLLCAGVSVIVVCEGIIINLMLLLLYLVGWREVCIHEHRNSHTDQNSAAWTYTHVHTFLMILLPCYMIRMEPYGGGKLYKARILSTSSILS